MPIYTYVCQDCGEKFDLLIGMTFEKTGLKCKKCNSSKIDKVLSLFSVGNSAGKSDLSCPTGTCPTGY